LIAGSMPSIVRAMHETHDKPDGGLIAALFCAIIGLIVYAGFVY
jgi:hypothetical protein